MIPAQDTIWISLEQLPARSPGFHPQSLLCFSHSGQRIPVNTQDRSRPSSSAQDLCGFLLTPRKSPSPPCSPQGPTCSAQAPPCPPLLPFILPPTALTLLQAPWPGCSSNTQASEPLHLLFPQPGIFFPEFITAPCLSLFRSQLSCLLLRSPL